MFSPNSGSASLQPVNSSRSIDFTLGSPKTCSHTLHKPVNSSKSIDATLGSPKTSSHAPSLKVLRRPDCFDKDSEIPDSGSKPCRHRVVKASNLFNDFRSAMATRQKVMLKLDLYNLFQLPGSLGNRTVKPVSTINPGLLARQNCLTFPDFLRRGCGSVRLFKLALEFLVQIKL